MAEAPEQAIPEAVMREADARIAEKHHAAPPPIRMWRADAYAYAVAHGAEIATTIRNS